MTASALAVVSRTVARPDQLTQPHVLIRLLETDRPIGELSGVAIRAIGRCAARYGSEIVEEVDHSNECRQFRCTQLDVGLPGKNSRGAMAGYVLLFKSSSRRFDHLPSSR